MIAGNVLFMTMGIGLITLLVLYYFEREEKKYHKNLLERRDVNIGKLFESNVGLISEIERLEGIIKFKKQVANKEAVQLEKDRNIERMLEVKDSLYYCSRNDIIVEFKGLHRLGRL